MELMETMPSVAQAGTPVVLLGEHLFVVFLNVISRVTHVGTAVVLVGGSAFMLFVLLPSAAHLADEHHDQLRQQVLARWRKFVPIGILLFFVSGFYNYIKVALPQHSGDGLYHALMGVKIILALVVFFIASALTGRSAALERVRENAKSWLLVLLLAAAVIIALAGFLKVRGPVSDDTARVPAPHGETTALHTVAIHIRNACPSTSCFLVNERLLPL